MRYLLLFLLIAVSLFACEQKTSSAPDKPITVTLPQPPSDLSDPAADVRYGVSNLVKGEYSNDKRINRGNTLTIRPTEGGYFVSTAKEGLLHNDEMLKRRIMEFVVNPQKAPHLAAGMNQAPIFLIDQTEGDTSWRQKALWTVRLAYTTMWDEQSRKRYGKKYSELSTDLKQTILDKAPPTISLAGPWVIPPPPPPPPRPVIERVPNS